MRRGGRLAAENRSDKRTGRIGALESGRPAARAVRRLRSDGWLAFDTIDYAIARASYLPPKLPRYQILQS